MSKLPKEDIGIPHITLNLEDLDSLPPMSSEDVIITREAAQRLGFGGNPIAFDVIETTSEKPNVKTLKVVEVAPLGLLLDDGGYVHITEVTKLHKPSGMITSDELRKWYPVGSNVLVQKRERQETNRIHYDLLGSSDTVDISPMTTEEAEASLAREMITDHEVCNGEAEHQPYTPASLSLDEIKERMERASALCGNGVIRACRRFLREVDLKKH